MEEFDVGVAEVTVEDTVKHAVEAGLGQGEPGQVDEHVGAHLLHRTDADRDSERHPKYNEHDEAEHVGLDEFVVPGKGHRRLVRATSPLHARY